MSSSRLLLLVLCPLIAAVGCAPGSSDGEWGRGDDGAIGDDGVGGDDGGIGDDRSVRGRPERRGRRERRGRPGGRDDGGGGDDGAAGTTGGGGHGWSGWSGWHDGRRRARRGRPGQPGRRARLERLVGVARPARRARLERRGGVARPAGGTTGAAGTSSLQQGCDYWVAPNGSDTAAGSEAAPFATFQKAYDTMCPPGSGLSGPCPAPEPARTGPSASSPGRTR